MQINSFTDGQKGPAQSCTVKTELGISFLTHSQSRVLFMGSLIEENPLASNDPGLDSPLRQWAESWQGKMSMCSCKQVTKQRKLL